MMLTLDRQGEQSIHISSVIISVEGLSSVTFGLFISDPFVCLALIPMN